MASKTPTVVGETLIFLGTTGQEQVIVVGSAEWQSWLCTTRCFAFEEDGFRLTAQPRRRGQQRYWYAYARAGFKVQSVYLGRETEVGLKQLRSAKERLASRGGVDQFALALDADEVVALLATTEARIRSAHRLRATDSRRLISVAKALAEHAEASKAESEAALVELDRLRWELQNRGFPSAKHSEECREVF